MSGRDITIGALAVLLAAACATGGGAARQGAGATWSGPEAGCPRIASHFGDWTSNYGSVDRMRTGDPPWNKPHNGIDFEVPFGTEVLAVAPGMAGGALQTHGGQALVVHHGEDTDGKHVFSFYQHLSEALVSQGQTVERGQAIARSGTFNTPHLHLSLFRTPIQDFRASMQRGDKSVLADPADYWADPKAPGFDPARTYPATPIRLTYPLRCERRRGNLLDFLTPSPPECARPSQHTALRQGSECRARSFS